MNTLRIIEQLKVDEGFRAKPYWDNDQWTYGFGTKANSRHDTITREEAQVQLRQRVEVAIDDFNLMFGDMEMDEVREEALVNMLFNLGRTKLTKFRKMVGAVRKKDWGNAAYEAFNSLWFRQLRKKGLTSIERSERIVWELLTGEKG